MIRKIIQIEEGRCNGCGLCATACHEGAIGMVDGKAKLLRDDYCDGLGDCLPTCPTGAISFVEREAAAYDEAAVKRNMAAKAALPDQSALANWPVQIKLAPIVSPLYQGADLLIAADCTAFAYGSFHSNLLAGKAALIGCPKLDAVDYAEKLTEILRANDVASVTVARMEVSCCGGLTYAVERALQASGKDIPQRTVVISTDGKILSDQ